MNLSQVRCDCSGNGADVAARIRLANAAEVQSGVSPQPIVVGLQRMLPGEDEGRKDTACTKRVGDRGELDGFGACTDCKRDGCGQLSP